jgi:alpha-ketoglutarate-dependent taurine dioxygenase
VAQPDIRLHKLCQPAKAAAREKAVGQMEHRESAISRLKSVRRNAIGYSSEALVKTRELAGSNGLVLLFEPAAPDLDLAGWAAHQRTLLERLVGTHGALLWRGFGINTPEEFERVASAVCPSLHAGYGDLPRAGTSTAVYASTPYPADQQIHFHCESAHLPTWPLRQWFACMEPSATGGQTPLCDTRRVMRRLDPGLLGRLRERGLLYVRNFGGGLDVTWEAFFGTQERSEVERLCREWGMDSEWKADGGLRTRQRRPAVVRHPGTGAEVFFNQLLAHHVWCVESGARSALQSLFAVADLPRHVYYGDGTEIEAWEVDAVREAFEAEAVEFNWERGDVLMLDNMLVAHGRRAYAGTRRIVVAMGEMFSDAALAQSGERRDGVTVGQ